jgi:hypothetical protein
VAATPATADELDHHTGFHPDLAAPELAAGDLAARRVHHVTSLSADTAQTEGMRRFAAISGASAGAERLWMGETQVAPRTVSGNHRHGEFETAIYVRSGHPEFAPENPQPDETAEIVIARSTQDAIVVNLPRLYPC